MVDAGAAAPAAVAALLEPGSPRVSSSARSRCPAIDALRRLRAALPEAPLVLSLDLRGGRLLSPDPALAALGARRTRSRACADAGVREAIVLDLARVGSGEGPDVALLAALRARFPEVELLAGGGVRDAADLRALADAGAAGALVATALHSGRRDRSSGAGGARRALQRRARVRTSAAATSTPVASSTPFQPGDAVDLDHVLAPVGAAQQVDAGVVGPEHRGRAHAHLRPLVVERDRRARGRRGRGSRASPSPTRSIAATTRSPTTSARDVDAVVGQRLLQVVDGALDLERAEHALGDVRVVDARHPEAPSSRRAA